jgi:hypothetical protein
MEKTTTPEQEPNRSPLPEKMEQDKDGVFTIMNNEMNFYDAIKAITENKVNVTRSEWNDKEEYCLLKDGLLTLHKADDKFYSWVISDGDILATDWIIV